MNSTSSSRIARLLLLCTLLFPAFAQDDNNVLRFTFDMGLFPDSALLSGSGPTETDIKGVMCQTQMFFSQLVQNATSNPSVQATISQVSWELDPTKADPVEINFTVALNPDYPLSISNLTANEQVLVDQMSSLDDQGLASFVVDWIWNSPPVGGSFFQNVNQLVFNGVVQPAPSTSILEDIGDCSALPATTTTSITTTTTDATASTAMTQPTTDAIATPTQAETEWNELWVQFRFGFYEGTPPVDNLQQQDAEGVLCETLLFFQQLMETNTGSPMMQVNISDISYRYQASDALPGQFLFKVDLKVDETTNDLGMANLRKVLVDSLAKLDDAQIQAFLQEYIWLAQPRGTNYFTNANSLEYGVNNHSPFSGTPMMTELTCPADNSSPSVAPFGDSPTLPPGAASGNFTSTTSGNKPIQYEFAFGFFNDTAGVPTDSDVQGALCQVNQFVTFLIENNTGISNVYVQSKNIDWTAGTDADGATTVNITFTTELSGGEGIVDSLPLSEMLLDASDACEGECLTSFVVDWIWKSEPRGQNFFANTNKLTFEGDYADPSQQGTNSQIETLACPGQEFPTSDGNTDSGTEATPSPAGTTTPGTPVGPTSSTMAPVATGALTIVAMFWASCVAIF